MNRRNFLGSIFAAGVAPAIVRVTSLMPVQVIAPPGIANPFDEAKAHILRLIEQQINARMELTRELVAYGVIRDGAVFSLMGNRNAGDTLVYRRFLPYGDVIATESPLAPRS